MDVKTLNLKRLTKNGVLFTQAYATSPICNPSRAGMITGCYQQRWGCRWYNGPGLPQNRPTIAEALKEQGYSTCYIGKVHYGGVKNKTDTRDFPLNHGFDYFFGSLSGGTFHYLKHTKKYLKKIGKNAVNRLGAHLLWKNKEKVETENWTTEIFGKEACSFIKKHKEQLFFMQVSFNSVHNYIYQLPDDVLVKKELERHDDWTPEKGNFKEWKAAICKPKLKKGRMYYLTQLECMDKQIGLIFDELEKFKLRDNTLICFISDNGGCYDIFADNRPLSGHKYHIQEGGIRVPMIISWPSRIQKSRINNEIVSAMDLFPTALDAAGGDQNKYKLDGTSLLPILSGQSVKLHDRLFWDTGKQWAVREGNWKLLVTEDEKWAAKTEQNFRVNIPRGINLYNIDKI